MSGTLCLLTWRWVWSISAWPSCSMMRLHTVDCGNRVKRSRLRVGRSVYVLSIDGACRWRTAIFGTVFKAGAILLIRTADCAAIPRAIPYAHTLHLPFRWPFHQQRQLERVFSRHPQHRHSIVHHLNTLRHPLLRTAVSFPHFAPRETGKNNPHDGSAQNEIIFTVMTYGVWGNDRQFIYVLIDVDSQCGQICWRFLVGAAIFYR